VTAGMRASMSLRSRLLINISVGLSIERARHQRTAARDVVSFDVFRDGMGAVAR
jgi:hypothetical protein